MNIQELKMTKKVSKGEVMVTAIMIAYAIFPICAYFQG